jgi:murein DD-endopeptidase MepM/ murein hydrolase activator NlpD
MTRLVAAHRTLGPSLAAALAALVLAACSSGSAADLAGSAAEPPGENDTDADAPNDDPRLGGEGVDVATDAGSHDAGTADAGPVLAGNDCVKGGLYCGGDKVTGDPKTLYRCNGPGAPTVVQVCANGCTVSQGTDDACAVAPSAKVPSPVPGKVVTYPFGVKNSGYAAGYHTGEDYATPTGSNAVAVRNGTIRWSNDNGGAYGKWMGLDADNGRTYVYCHLSSRLYASGTKVVAGQVIAKTGATGNVTGPHLHFEDHPLGPFVYAQVRKPSW